MERLTLDQVRSFYFPHRGRKPPTNVPIENTIFRDRYYGHYYRLDTGVLRILGQNVSQKEFKLTFGIESRYFSLGIFYDRHQIRARPKNYWTRQKSWTPREILEVLDPYRVLMPAAYQEKEHFNPPTGHWRSSLERPVLDGRYPVFYQSSNTIEPTLVMMDYSVERGWSVPYGATEQTIRCWFDLPQVDLSRFTSRHNLTLNLSLTEEQYRRMSEFLEETGIPMPTPV